MKKEYFIFIIAGLVLFQYILDTVSGPIGLNIKNPFMFLQFDIISIYPLTAVSIGVKAIALLIFVPLALSVIKKQHVLKGIIVFVLAAVFELYAIQQLATGFLITSIPWTLSFAYTGVGLLILSISYLMMGFFKRISSLFSQTDNPEEEFNF